ncbi:MAG: DUF2878 domain-containing protein [Acidobacteria bacterium]|nr:DUF2878 domain-containing protein [Acidobacteriota bacterium]
MPLRSFANLIGFQLVWFTCVLGAAAGMPWLGVGVLLGVLAGHFVFPVAAWRRELALLGAAALLGMAAETLLHQGAAVVGYPPQAWTGAPAPSWMVALWINFAATLHGCLAWMQGRIPAAALAGALAGPLSYWGGERLGAITLHPDPVHWIVGIGLVWATATPVLIWLAEVTA